MMPDRQSERKKGRDGKRAQRRPWRVMKQERIKKRDEENVKREVREWDKRRIWIGTPKKKKEYMENITAIKSCTVLQDSHILPERIVWRTKTLRKSSMESWGLTGTLSGLPLAKWMSYVKICSVPLGKIYYYWCLCHKKATSCSHVVINVRNPFYSWCLRMEPHIWYAIL